MVMEMVMEMVMTFAGSIAAGLVSASSGIYDTLLLCKQDRFSLLAYDVSTRASLSRQRC
jgi:hypothetical protein